MPRNIVRPVNPTAGALADGLHDAIQKFHDLPRQGIPALRIVRGISPECVTTENLENKLGEIGDILAESGRVYVQGDCILFEAQDGLDRRLVPLLLNGEVQPNAAGLLGNLLKCEHHNAQNERRQFPPTQKIASSVLLMESVANGLRRIKLYAKRPVFDKDFNLCQPGWNPGAQYLIHGPAVAATVAEEPQHNPGTPALNRLPTRLRRLLAGFCFATDADLAAR